MSIAGRPEPHTPRIKRRKLSHNPEDHGDSDRIPDGSGSTDEDDLERGISDNFEIPTEKVDQRVHGTSNGTNTRRTNLPGSDKTSILEDQLGQLLADTVNSETLLSTVESKLDRMCKLIESTSETEPFSVTQAENWLRNHGNVTIPFPAPRPHKDSNLKFQYLKPTSVRANGFMSGRVRPNGPQTIRFEVVMPQSSLQEKDYLNLRAFHKRAFTLACIAANIANNADEDFVTHFVHDDDVELLPVLRLRPRSMAKAPKDLDFFITVNFPEDTFPSSKCNPTKNCVRPMEDINSIEFQPTPFYNSCLLSQTCVKRVKQTLEKARNRCNALWDTCWIAQHWLTERGFSSDMSCGGFGMNEWRLMCAILLDTGGHSNHSLFSDRYSHLQLFKAMLQVLAGRDMTDPWVLRSSLSILPTDCPVFYDGEHGFNILYKMSPWSYRTLRQQARHTISALNAKKEDNFELVFCTAVAEPVLQYDEVVTILLPSATPKHAAQPQEIIRKLCTVLKRGLGDRVGLLNLLCMPSDAWSVQKHQPNPSKEHSRVRVCLLINSEATSRLVDHGPSADEQEEATEFRKFWGEKADLRRFKDGSISESLVWSADEPVTLQIIRHLIKRHFQQPHSAVAYRSHRLDSMLLPHKTDLSPARAFNLINTQYQALTSTLHNLESLPLPIRSISPAHPSLRSSALPHPMNTSNSAPINLLIQFDSSTRWPDSLPAIQHTKIAFLVKLSDLLQASDTSITTRVGLEHTSSSTSGYLNTSFFDIIYPSSTPTLAPTTFRLRIHHDRELHLLQIALTDKSLHGSIREQLASALATHKRQFLSAPIHTTAIRNLVTKFPPLSPTIRLLKKWISSHLLTRLIPEEALEIIAAHIFLHPYPWNTPGSPTTAFFRCIWFLSRWDWAHNPLIVDLSLSQDMSLDQREKLKTAFAAWRKLDPSMNNVVWFIGSSVDETGVVWTQSGRPEKVVATRVQALAVACMEIITKDRLEMSEESAMSLFWTPMDEFDFQLKLDKKLVRSSVRRKGKGDGFKNLQITPSLTHDTIGFEPVELYLRDLEKAFGNVALFFYDSEGGRVIAGLWRPVVAGRKEWRVRMGFSTKPVVEKERGKEKERVSDEKEAKVVGEFNREAVLAEMRMMGEGIVMSVTIKE